MFIGILLPLLTSEIVHVNDTNANLATMSACGAFEFKVPQGTKELPGHGIDSCVKEFKGPGFSLTYDYGIYSSELKNAEHDPKFHSSRVVVDGMSAFIVSGAGGSACREAQMIMGVEIDHFDPNGEFDRPTGLAMWACLKNPEDAATIRAIFLSIRHIGHAN